MTVYAKGTSVSVAKSRAEIESMLSRYGASSFASGWDGPTAVIMFEAKGRRIRCPRDLATEARSDEHALMAVTVLAGFAQLNNLEASFIEKLEATFPAMRTPSKEGSAKS